MGQWVNDRCDKLEWYFVLARELYRFCAPSVMCALDGRGEVGGGGGGGGSLGWTCWRRVCLQLNMLSCTNSLKETKPWAVRLIF